MNVRARAPGKIILAGEHAVVHGSTAVAASIDLYTYVTLTSPNSAVDDTLKLQLIDEGLNFSWGVDRIKEELSHLRFPFPSNPTSCSSESLKLITSLFNHNQIPESKIAIASGISSFLWLYLSIVGFKPATVSVTSDLPLGSGLGSSASFCVAVSAALHAFSESSNPTSNHQEWFTYSESDLELVNKWAFEGEKIIHGKPSGIDNTISTHGNIIKFKSGELSRIKTNIKFEMLITNTRVGRNTKALVGSVAMRMARHEEAMAAVFSAVDSISRKLVEVLQSEELSVGEKEEEIGELMEMNQGLLRCMGVSHPSIDAVIRTTEAYKLSSKLTGAGGGGCVLSLIPSSTGALREKVTKELEALGYQCLVSRIGGNGVEISFR